MRETDWTPSIVPGGEDLDVCLVMNDFGRRGRAWCEADVEAADLETVIQDLLDGQYSDPVRVVSFNTGEDRARDISADSPRSCAVGAIYRARGPFHYPWIRRAARTVPASADTTPWSEGGLAIPVSRAVLLSALVVWSLPARGENLQNLAIAPLKASCAFISELETKADARACISKH
jgi:hypothetical protein